VLEDLQVQLPLVLEDEAHSTRANADQPNDTASGAHTPCPVLNALGYDPVGLDELQARTGMSTPALQARLWELEMQGALNRLPGGLFQQAAMA
jgi:DNA processing protein